MIYYVYTLNKGKACSKSCFHSLLDRSKDERQLQAFTVRLDDPNASDTTPATLEDPAGLRNYLPCVGLDVPCDPHRCARGPAVPARRNALLRCRHRALCLDARERNNL